MSKPALIGPSQFGWYQIQVGNQWFTSKNPKFLLKLAAKPK